MDVTHLTTTDILALWSSHGLDAIQIITQDQLLELELAVMDAVAVKVGGDLVHWDASHHVH